MPKNDQAAAERIKNWLETRTSARLPWKRVSRLARGFGLKRLTSSGKQRISDALASVGIELEPSLQDLKHDDVVRFKLGQDIPSAHIKGTHFPTEMDRLPSQIITWDASNIGEDDGTEQWLPCLKATIRGDRQFIWEGGTKRGIVGMVTFSGQLRNKGRIEGWGRHDSFQHPISREELLGLPATAERFGPRGIKALQGSAIRVTEDVAQGIIELLGGPPPLEIPWGDPDDSEAIPWVSHRGLPAEKFTENAILQSRAL